MVLRCLIEATSVRILARDSGISIATAPAGIFMKLWT